MISYSYTFLSSNTAPIHVSEKGVRLIISFLSTKQTSIKGIENCRLNDGIAANSSSV